MVEFTTVMFPCIHYYGDFFGLNYVTSWLLVMSSSENKPVYVEVFIDMVLKPFTLSDWLDVPMIIESSSPEVDTDVYINLGVCHCSYRTILQLTCQFGHQMILQFDIYVQY